MHYYIQTKSWDLSENINHEFVIEGLSRLGLVTDKAYFQIYWRKLLQHVNRGYKI
jgi:hypothetical protein